MIKPLYCRNCGTRLPTDGLFCPTCGTSQAADGHAPTNLSVQEPSVIGTGKLPPGRMLHQRYCLLHTVGQGGMGAVYVAQDTQLGDRLVAVKEMSMSRLTPQELPHAVEQFRSEAHLLASLQHPSLPVIHEYFNEDDRWYLVMSFIEGQNLQAALDSTSDKKLPLKEVVRIGIELCEVLDYLHSHVPQIIFRDLKPSNIMLTSKGHICLIDFGIARHFKQEQTKDTAYYYSVGYAPPEQYGQSQTSPRSDIYSLGATLHQMLSGQSPSRKPFQFSPLQLIDPTIPAALAKLIAQMLEMDEQSRPLYVTDVKMQIEQVLTTGQMIIAGQEKPIREEKVEKMVEVPKINLKQSRNRVSLSDTITREPKFLACVSYLLFCVTGIIVLCFKKNQNRFIRFHALQSIFITYFTAILAGPFLVLYSNKCDYIYCYAYDYGSYNGSFLYPFWGFMIIGIIYWLIGMIQVWRGKMGKLFPVGYLAGLFVRKKELYNEDLPPFYAALPRAKSSERFMSTLSYLLPGIPGFFYLLLPFKSRFVRFHVFQSTLLFIPMIVLTYLSILTLAPVTVPIFVGGWIMGIRSSRRGEYCKLPLVGDFVEKRISRNYKLR